MAFCTNCGSEIPEGTRFCANCGAPIGNAQNDVSNTGGNNVPETATASSSYDVNNQSMYEQNVYQQQTNMRRQSEADTVSGLDKYGKFIGIGLLILAVVDFATDPPILTIILSAAIIGGAVFCLAKKYKLKGFPIAAIVLAAFCLLAGVNQANRYGMFKIPGNDKIAEDLTEERATTATATEQVASEPPSVNDGTKTELFNQKSDNEPAGNQDDAVAATDSDMTDESKDEDITETTDQTSGVDPDLKAFLDSYEEFVDEYVVFMKKYMADPTNAVSMLSEYSEIMGKYSDFAEKVDQYDSKEMSTEDAKYYLEVTTRCSQKMLDIYSN